MDVSTNGILYFGIELGDEEDVCFPWDDFVDEENDIYVDDYVAHKLGVDEPDIPYEGNEELYSKFWEEKSAAIKATGCEVDYHGSSACVMYYVTLTAKHFTAHRGYPTEIKPEDLVVTDEQKEQLKKFCEIIGVEWKEPKWMLASYWSE